MKLAFSTLGCPDWYFDDVYSVACDLGYNGIEIRGIADEIYAPKIKVFDAAHMEKTKSRLAKAKLQIPVLTSGAYLANNPNLGESEFETKDYILLAQSLGVPFVRVLGEKEPHPEAAVAIDAVCKKYVELCKFAANFGITLLIETNGFLANTKTMKEFMEMASQPNMGVIWDIHHPYRFFDETPEQTIENIGGYIKHVHVKDSVKGRNGKITYMLTGYGDVPVDEAVRKLKAMKYDGYISYEWVKRWSRELADAGIAFHQYINYMRNIL